MRTRAIQFIVNTKSAQKAGNKYVSNKYPLASVGMKKNRQSTIQIMLKWSQKIKKNSFHNEFTKVGLNKGGKVCAHHNYNSTKIQFLFFSWSFSKIRKAELNSVSLPEYLNFTNFSIYTTNFLFFSKCWWELIPVKPVRKDWLFWAKIDLFSLLSLIIISQWSLLFGSKVSIPSVCLLVYSIVFVFASFVYFLVFFLFLHSNFCLFSNANNKIKERKLIIYCWRTIRPFCC